MSIKMESVHFLDDEGVNFDELYQSHLEKELLDLEKPDSVVFSPLSSSNLNTPSPTLASLNAFDTASDNLFDLDFEGNFHLDSSTDMNKNVIGEWESDVRSPSPMSMASVSGSEPYSPTATSPSYLNVEETDKDLLEYLLQDAGNEDDDEGGKETTENGRQRQHNFMRRSVAATNGGTIGLSSQQRQGGPWCKTKNRNESRNAIAARDNRLKKKAYVQGLEEVNSRLSMENAQLRKESIQTKKKMGSLKEEVLYLRKVLVNQSSLAGLLKKMDQSDVVLSGSVKRNDQTSSTSSSGGICVHMDGEEASLKFCASCARKEQP